MSRLKADAQRWNVSEPAFLLTILRIMLGMWAVAVVMGTLICRPALLGLFTGGALAIGLYLIALQTGRVFIRSKHFARIMLSLYGLQALLWTTMAVLIIVVKVDAAGFAIGAAVLPLAVIFGTLYGWLIVHKGSLA